LTHAAKPDSRYQNTPEDYEKLVDLCARGRVEQFIPWEAIEDETRPIDLNVAFYNPAEFFSQELGGFLAGYWRNRQQSQPHHIEIVAEKLTMRTILRPVAQEYTIPMTIGRGMTSLSPKKKIFDRYRLSQKRKLILLVVTDLDPAGEAIAEDMFKSLRRDFGVTEIEAYKVALTLEQVEDFDLAPSMEAKVQSPTYRAFVERYGITDAYELDALAPSDLVDLLEDGIQKVLDIDAYNVELAAEEADSAQIVAVREQVDEFFRTLHLGTSNDGKTC